MNKISTLWLASLLLAAVPGTGAGTIRLSFDADAPGTVPAFLRFESSAGLSGARWLAEPSDSPVTTPNIAVQTDSSGSPGQYRFALSTEAKSFRNGSVQASLRCVRGKNACGAGVVLRFVNPGNFVAAVCDLKTSTVTVLSMHDGTSQALGSARFESRERLWTTVTLDADGSALAVRISDRPVLTAKDPHPRAGEAGLLAEAGSVQSFDELVLAPR